MRLAEAVSGLDVLALAGDRLLAAGMNGLVAYSLRDGAVLWRKEATGGSASRVRVVGDVCLVSRGSSLDFHAVADGAPLGAARPYGPALVVTPGTRRIFVWRDERSSVEFDGRGGTIRGIPGKVVAADDDHLLVREADAGREGLVVIALRTGAPVVRLGGAKASLGEATVARGRVFYEDRARGGLYERVLATGQERLLHRTGPRVVVGGDKVGVAPGVLLAPPRILGDHLILEDMNVLFAWRVF